MAIPQTLQEVLEQRAHSPCPGHMLFYPLGNTHSPTKLSYADLYEEAKQNSRVVQSLQQSGVGRPVLLHFDDHRDTVVWFWSTLLAGGLPVLSSPFSNIEDERNRHIRALSALLESPVCLTRAKYLPVFGDSHGLHLYPVESLAEGPNQLPHHTKTTGGAGHVDKRDGGQAKDLQNGDHPSGGITTHGSPNGTADGEDLAVLMLTSGSTGNAKAVPLRHAQVLASMRGKLGARELPPGRPFFNWIGLDHVAGLLEIHLQALVLGADQVHVSAADVVPSPETFLDLLSRHGASRTFAPNFFLAKLVSAVGAREQQGLAVPGWDLSGLLCITSGGEANDTKTTIAATDLLARFGAPRNVIMPGYGMTEICAGATYNTDCPEYDRARGYPVISQGPCIDGMELRITTTTGGPGGQTARAATDEPGDIEVRGAVVFRGYYRNVAATEEAFTPDGWFRTGDRGFMDSNGIMSLVGRAKEVININGVKFVAADLQAAVEDALGDRVARVLVFPSKAAHTEQVTVAYIPKAFPARDDERVEIVRLVTQACLISTATRPLVFALREESIPRLPISTLGKISRLKVARLFEDGEFAVDVEIHDRAIQSASNTAEELRKSQPQSTSEAERHLLEDVAQTLSLAPGDLDIHPETSLFDIGFTSMHVIKLKYHIERRLGTEVSVLQIMKNPTVRALAAGIDTQPAHHPGGAGPGQGSPSSDSYDPVVVLRAGGSKPPLWLIHPGSGEVLVFMGLARCLAADDRPVYALRAPGFEPNSKRFESIDQAVGAYTAAVRRTQPRGPYALAGYSYGAVLAFEVAKRLGGGGGGGGGGEDGVRFLASLDLPPHVRQRMRALAWNVCLLHLCHFLGLITEGASGGLEDDAAFCGAARQDAMRWVLGIADKQRWGELRLEADALARWVDVSYGLQHMAGEYEPSGRVGNIDVFHCAPETRNREGWLSDYLKDWADFASEPPRFHAVQGEHYTMIGDEHVQSFAQCLMEAMKARGV